MGWYPYTQYCIHGHSWPAHFCSVDLSSSHQDTCPECGTDQIGTDNSMLFKGYNMDLDTTKVNRFEVIDHTDEGTGRDFVKWKDKLDVQIALQDSGRTLKVFLEDKK